MPSQWERFKQSNIAKIVIGYSLVVWVLIQLIEAVLPTFETPLWVAQTLTFLLILGFPIALLVGWAYEKLPSQASEGDGEEPSTPRLAHSTPKRTLVLVGAGSCAVIGLFGFYMMPFIFDQSSYDRRSSDTLAPSRSNVAPILARGIRSTLMLGETGVSGLDGTRTDVSISPDGNLVAYLDNSVPGSSKLMLRDLRFLEPGMQISNIAWAGGGGVLKFSPDGEWIVFQDGGSLKRVRVEGGASQEIASQGLERPRLQASHAIIGQDLYYITAGDFQVSKTAFSGETNTATRITSDSAFYSAPASIPGDSTNLLVTYCSEAVTNWGDCDVALLDIETGEPDVLIQTAHDATYSRSGHILFIRDSSLWAVPYDASTAQITGSQVPVIQGVEGNSNRGHSAYSLSATGRLVYSQGTDIFQGAQRIDITWVDKEGVRSTVPLPEGVYGNLNISPDEKRLAFTNWAEGTNDIWTWDLEQEILSRLTFDGNASTPIWTRDGRDIIYMKTVAPYGLWSVSSNGTGQPFQVVETQEQAFPETITDQGEILFSVGGQRKLYSSSEVDDRIQNLIDIGPAQVRSSRISDDGKWLLYTSNESGDFETFIRPWPNVDDGKWQASRQGGGQPLWNQADQTIYFWSAAGRQYSTKYDILEDQSTGQQSFRFQEPIEMFAYNEPRSNVSLPGWTYSHEKDMFLMVAQGGLTSDSSLNEQILNQQTNLTLVENLFDELDSVAPSDSN